MRFPFAERRLIRARIDDTRNNGNGAAHPDFIKPRTVHVVRIVRLRSKAEASTWRTKCPTGVTVQQLQHTAVTVEAVIENRSRFSTASVDDILLGVLVQFIREN